MSQIGNEYATPIREAIRTLDGGVAGAQLFPRAGVAIVQAVSGGIVVANHGVDQDASTRYSVVNVATACAPPPFREIRHRSFPNQVPTNRATIFEERLFVKPVETQPIEDTPIHPITDVEE